MTIYRFATMFPDEMRARLETRPLLVMPLGTLEWHSYHAPLGLDGLVAQALSERIADLTDGVVTPTSYWAVGGVPFPYTLRLPIPLIEPLLRTLFEQFAAMGFQVIVAFTGHFGLDQTLALKRSAVEAMRQSSVTILPLTEYDLTTDHGYLGDHAATGETSLLWALAPELARVQDIPRHIPLDGVIGDDPRETASSEFGAELAQVITTRTADWALRLLQRTTPAERGDYLEALSVAAQALEATAAQRRVLPKASAPPITTPAYVAYCDALYRGDYRAAKAHAERKLAVLSN